MPDVFRSAYRVPAVLPLAVGKPSHTRHIEDGQLLATAPNKPLRFPAGENA